MFIVFDPDLADVLAQLFVPVMSIGIISNMVSWETMKNCLSCSWKSSQFSKSTSDPSSKRVIWHEFAFQRVPHSMAQPEPSMRRVSLQGRSSVDSSDSSSLVARVRVFALESRFSTEALGFRV